MSMSYTLMHCIRPCKSMDNAAKSVYINMKIPNNLGIRCFEIIEIF